MAAEDQDYRPELTLLVEQETDQPNLARPAVLPKWWPLDWLMAFWTNKYISNGNLPVLSEKDQTQLNTLYPEGWSLAFRPKEARFGKKSRAKGRAAFEKGDSWCAIPTPPANKHKFRIKELAITMKGTVTFQSYTGKAEEQLDVQVFTGNWVPLSSSSIPSKPGPAYIMPEYTLHPIWNSAYNSFLAMYRPAVDFGISREASTKWPIAIVAGFFLREGPALRDILARFGPPFSTGEDGVPIIPDLGRRFISYILDLYGLSPEFEDVMTAFGHIKKVEGQLEFSISFTRYPNDSSFMIRNWRGDLDLNRVRRVLERLFISYMPSVTFHTATTKRRKELIEEIESRAGILNKRKMRWIRPWQKNWKSRPGVMADGDSARIAILLIHDPEYGIQLIERLAALYTDKQSIFDINLADREASIKKQWELLEEIISVVKKMDQEIAESVTVAGVGVPQDNILSAARARIAEDASVSTVGEDILKTMELSGGSTVSYEGSSELASATVGRLNQCWHGLLHLEERSSFSDGPSHVMIHKTKPTSLPGYLQKPVPECFKRS